MIEFSEPRPNLPAELALPRYALVLSNSQNVGTGAFKVTEQRTGVLVLATNDDYWQGRPFLNSVEVTTGRAERDQALDLEVGRADVIEAGAAQLRRIQQQRVRVTSTRPADLVALRIRTLKPALQDIRTREAIAASIDRASIQKVIVQGEGEVTGALLPNWATGCGFLFSAARDLARGQRLAKELGQSTPITIATEADPMLQLVAERVALNLKDAGLNVQLAPSVDRADLVVRRVGLSSADPEVALRQVADAFSMDAPAAMEGPQMLYEQERSLLDARLTVPLVFMPRTVAVSPKVRNWTTVPMSGYHFEDVWMAEPSKP